MIKYLIVLLITAVTLFAQASEKVVFDGKRIQATFHMFQKMNPGAEQIFLPLVFEDYEAMKIYGVGTAPQNLISKLNSINMKPAAVNFRTGGVTTDPRMHVATFGLVFYKYNKVHPLVNINSYNESAFVIAVVDSSLSFPLISDVKYYIWDIKVSDSLAIRAGRQLWNYPKTPAVTEIYPLKNGDAVGRINAGDNYNAPFLSAKCSNCASLFNKMAKPEISAATLLTSKMNNKGINKDLSEKTFKFYFKSYCSKTMKKLFDKRVDSITLDKNQKSAFNGKLLAADFKPLIWSMEKECEGVTDETKYSKYARFK